MIETLSFQSAFAKVFLEYLKIREKQGVNIRHELTLMRELDVIMAQGNMPVDRITREIVEKWLSMQTHASERTRYSKTIHLIRFCKYLCHIGIDSYIMPLPKRPANSFVPRIFSDEEIAAIFAAADATTLQKHMPSSGLISLPIILRFLYYAGTRVGETLDIDNGDVDMTKGTILLRKTKNRKHRIIPLNDEMKSVLKQYLSYRRQLKVEDVDNPQKPLFISGNGSRLTSNAIYVRFKRILREVGIPHIGKQQGPRIHDMRHTFAVHSLRQMVDSGLDIYTSLPILSVLLGHTNVYSTESYLRLTIQMFPDIVNKTGDATSAIFPNLDEI